MGGDEGPEHFKAHRLVGAWEFAKLARQAADAGRVVIAAGDFNSVPTAPPMSIIRSHAGLKDAWEDTHPSPSSSSSYSSTQPLSPADAIRVHGVTADSPLNSFSAGKQLENHARKFHGKRLDYVFYRSPTHATTRLRCVQASVRLTEDVPGRAFSYSDHFGLEVVFEISPVKNGEEDGEEGAGEGESVPSVSNAAEAPQHALPPDLIASTIASLTARYRFATAQSRTHLSIFIVCLLLLLALIVSSPFLPLPRAAWLNPLFVLMTAGVSWLGTTMLYVGFVYGRWEVNALTNVIEELEIYRAVLEERGEAGGARGNGGGSYGAWRAEVGR